MRVLPGEEVTDATLTSSTVAEDPSPAWTSGPYVAGNVVHVVSVHRVYQAIVESTNKNPVTDPDAATYWLDIGPTNKWKMFDLVRDKPNTGTTAASPITVVLTPGRRIDSIALFGLVATAVRIDVTVDGESVYSFTQSLSRRGTTGWYSYYFGRFSFASAVARINLPPITGAVITVTVTRTTGDVTVGGLIYGMSVYLGITGPAVDGAQNLSSIVRDLFGYGRITRRRTIPSITTDMLCKATNLREIRRIRDLLSAAPALWMGLDDQDHPYFESTLLFGIYLRMDIPLEHAADFIVPLELQAV